MKGNRTFYFIESELFDSEFSWIRKFWLDFIFEDVIKEISKFKFYKFLSFSFMRYLTTNQMESRQTRSSKSRKIRL